MIERGANVQVYVRGDEAVRVAAVPSIGAVSVSGAWPLLADGAGGFALTVEGFRSDGTAVLFSKPQYFTIGD